MYKARSAADKCVADKSNVETARDHEATVASQNSAGTARRRWRHTEGIEICGVGESADKERFLEVAVKSKTAILNVDKISAPQSSELKILTRLGEPLVKSAARTEFINRAHDASRAEPSFKVAKMTGYDNGRFIFPVGLAADRESDVRRYFDWRYETYHRRLNRAGSPKKWLKLARLCRGKSRLITGLCLALSGPVCGKYGDEPPGIQLISKGGMGNTTIGRVVCTVWGGDRNATRKIGCGVSWNNTEINVEVLAGAFNHMFLYMDDMHNAGEAELKAVQNAMNGEGRGRSTDAQRAEFSTPVLSSSNMSIIQTARELKRQHLIIPLIDRLMELSIPQGCPYFFEGIRTKEEMRAFGNQLRTGARENFGWAGPEFVKRLDEWDEADGAAVQSFIAKRQDSYFEAASGIASAAERDLGRIENKFSTIFVSGCLAVRLKILPFSEAEILDAVLTCHRDHVMFVDQQLAAKGARPFLGVDNIPLASGPMAIAGVRKPAERPYVRLHRILNAKPRKGFRDLRKPGAKVSDKPPTYGFIGWSGRRGKPGKEFWIPEANFVEITGGVGAANELKRELYEQGLIETHGKGKMMRFSIRRPLPDGSRRNFIVVRARAKKQTA